MSDARSEVREARMVIAVPSGEYIVRRYTVMRYIDPEDTAVKWGLVQFVRYTWMPMEGS
jgi:hypothetical protein